MTNMMETQTALLSERLRPQKLDDLVIPASLRENLRKQIASRSPLNMMFYGRPGIGKTTTARIFLKELEADSYEINGSFNNGEKTMLRDVEAFAKTVSLTGGFKICFIDEADQMSRQTQDALRYLIENVSGNARFILTVNDRSRMTEALQSRCMPISFDILPSQYDAMLAAALSRYQERLGDLGVRFDGGRLEQIVRQHFSDMRGVANALQFEYGG